MDYSHKLKYHLKPEEGWVNDPNGLVFFGGYYHVFYQYCPHFEVPRMEPMHWGHARTKDFLLEPETSYEKEGLYNGCVFPTGNVVKDGILYVYYGCADKYVSLATANFQELIDYLWTECRED